MTHTHTHTHTHRQTWIGPWRSGEPLPLVAGTLPAGLQHTAERDWLSHQSACTGQWLEGKREGERGEGEGGRGRGRERIKNNRALSIIKHSPLMSPVSATTTVNCFSWSREEAIVLDGKRHTQNDSHFTKFLADACEHLNNTHTHSPALSCAVM